MITVEKWKYGDLEQIARLEQICFEKGAWTQKMLADSFSQKNFYGLKICSGEEIIAYIGASFTPWEGEIMIVATKPECRKKGYAQKLISSVLDYARLNGVEKVFLEVRESNDKAISLYKKMGFIQYGTRKKYYENTEDCINMVYTIKE